MYSRLKGLLFENDALGYRVALELFKAIKADSLLELGIKRTDFELQKINAKICVLVDAESRMERMMEDVKNEK